MGFRAFKAGSSLVNSTAIGANSAVTASNNMVFGDNNVVGWGFGVVPGPFAITVGTNASNGNGATLTLAGAWTTGSDSTKKRNITNINYGLKEVMQMRPVRYIWKNSDQEDFGFLAQELKHVLPEIVYGKEGQMTISYGQITSVLTKAIQELNAEKESQSKFIVSQQRQLAEQKKQIEEIKKQLKVLEMNINKINKKTGN